MLSIYGHHVYKRVWRPITQYSNYIPVLSEPGNQHDKRAIAVYQDVGHVPKSYPTFLASFLRTLVKFFVR